MSTHSVQQPANGTRTASDVVLLTQQLDGVGGIVGGGLSTAVAGAGTANVTTSDGSVVAANTNRRGFQVVNDSDTTVYLGLGTAALANAGIRLNANGGSWDGLVSGVLWRGTLRSIHAGTGTKVLTYVEL